MGKNEQLIKNQRKKVHIQANLNNLEPGDSVNEHRHFKTGNLIQAKKEIGQQNNNL